MAMTISELAELSKQAGYNLEVVPDDSLLHGSWVTQRYRDSDGDLSLQIFLLLLDDGEYVVAVSPRVYNLNGCSHRAAAIEAMTRIAYITPYIGYELDREDGEIRVTVEFPIGSGSLTVEQLKIMVAAVLWVDHYDPVVRHAMKTGEIRLELADEPPAEDRSELDELVAKIGGLDKLRELAAARGGGAPKS